MRLVSALVLAMLASILVPSAMTLYLPFDRGDLLIWTGLTIPLLWTIFVVFCYWPENKWHPFVSLGLIVVVAGGLVGLAWVGA